MKHEWEMRLNKQEREEIRKRCDIVESIITDIPMDKWKLKEKYAVAESAEDVPALLELINEYETAYTDAVTVLFKIKKQADALERALYGCCWACDIKHCRNYNEFEYNLGCEMYKFDEAKFTYGGDGDE